MQQHETKDLSATNETRKNCGSPKNKMPDKLEADYKTLSREELVKVATDLRAERDKFRDERDVLRRIIRTDMRRFCEGTVPDFTPLGGNRPDCAVASAAAVALSDVTFNNVTVGTWADNPLPPDVFVCAAGILCAPVIITGNLWSVAARRVCERRGPARTLSIRLRFKSEEEMRECNDGSFPWDEGENDYQSVLVKVELPPEVVTLPQPFFYKVGSVKSVDLRSTRLTALSDYCISAPQLSQVDLPSTVTSIGRGFLPESGGITSVDLRHLTGLTSLDGNFMYACDSLTEVYLPDSVTQLPQWFLLHCASNPVCHWAGDRDEFLSFAADRFDHDEEVVESLAVPLLGSVD